MRKVIIASILLLAFIVKNHKRVSKYHQHLVLNVESFIPISEKLNRLGKNRLVRVIVLGLKLWFRLSVYFILYTLTYI